MSTFQSFASDKFWKCYYDLPEDIQQLADKAYELFCDNPKHPAVQFKKVGNKEPIYSARITDNYRALCFKQAKNLYWFWLGNHAEYEKMIRKV